MSVTAPLAALPAAVKPADSAGLRLAPGGGPAFQAVVASLGYQSLQRPGQLALAPAASIGRDPNESGNIVPLPYLLNLAQIPEARVSTRSDVGPAVASAFGDLPAVINGEASLQPDGAQRRTNHDRVIPADDILQRRPLENIGTALKDLDPSILESASGAAMQLKAQKLAHALNGIDTGGQIPIISGNVTNTAITTGNGSPLSTQVPFALNDPRFADGFSQTVSILARDGVQHARISINPPELGPVELRIVVRNEEATVQMASQVGAVRSALEDALPRLRDNFEQAGLRLADSEVFNELPGRGDQRDRPGDDNLPESWVGEVDVAVAGEPATHRLQQGFVDAYV